MTDLEKLRVLLPHWITHNREHGEEFKRWAEDIEKAGHKEVAGALKRAIEATKEATGMLEHCLELAGGPLEKGPGGDHPHHHHHPHRHHGH